MNDKKNYKMEGLPEIAQNLSKGRVAIYGLLVLVMLFFAGMYFWSRHTKENEHAIDETYTIEDKSKNVVDPIVETTAVQTSRAPNKNVVKGTLTNEQIAFIQEKQKELQLRLSSPLMIVNNSSDGQVTTSPQDTAHSNDPNTEFLNQTASKVVETSTPTQLGSLSNMIAEGTIIHATLEPAINSDLPGSLRAEINEPVFSEDGTALLIPVGSRLIGQYKSGISLGQSRIFVVWTRLITTTGLSLQLGSEGVDSLGQAGMEADQVNRHFWERFGTASLLSIIGAGAANLNDSDQMQANASPSYREGLVNSFSQSASQSLGQDENIAPTLKTYQGKPIDVFLSRDLRMDNTSTQNQQKLMIF